MKLQVVIVTQKPSCKASCKSPICHNVGNAKHPPSSFIEWFYIELCYTTFHVLHVSQDEHHLVCFACCATLG